MTDITKARSGGQMAPPVSYPPIVIPQPANPKSTCIHSDWFPNLNIDVQRDYAKHYNIPNATNLSCEEIVSILCTKNQWIPALEEHEWDVTGHGVNPFRRVPSGPIEKTAEEERHMREARYGKLPFERHPSPEDEYEFVSADGGQQSGEADKGKDKETPVDNEDGDEGEWHPYSRPPLAFQYPPVPRVVGEDEAGATVLEPLDPDWLRCMADELERHHLLLKTAIEEARLHVREAEADAFELTMQIAGEKKFRQQIFEFISDISGRKVAEEIEDDVAYAMENGELPGRGADWYGYGSDDEEVDDEGDDEGNDGGDGDNEDDEEQDTQPIASQSDFQPPKGSRTLPSPPPPPESQDQGRRFQFEGVERNDTRTPFQAPLKRAREEEEDEDNNGDGSMKKVDRSEGLSDSIHNRDKRPHKRLRLDEGPEDLSSSSDGEDSPMEEAVGIPWHAYDDDESDSSYSPSTSEDSEEDSDDGDSESGYLSSSLLSSYSEDEVEVPKSASCSQESQPTTSTQNSEAPPSYAHLSAKHRPAGKPEKSPQPRAKRLKRDNERLIIDPETGDVQAQDYTKTEEYKERREAEEKDIARLDALAPEKIPCDINADLAEITSTEGFRLFEFDRWEWRDFVDLVG